MADWLVNDVCPALGDELAGSCALFAPVLVPKAFTWAEQELPQVCDLSGLCDSEKVAQVQAVEVGSAACSLCKFVVQEVEDYLQANATEATIVAEADKLCDKLPGDLAATCEDYVTSYAPTIIALLEQAVPAEKICEAITLCDKPAVAAAPSNDDCATCEFVLASAKTALSDNSTITSIVAKANDLCEEYAGDYAQECEEYVTAWGPQLLAKAGTLIDPETDCTKLGLCDSAKPCAHIPLRRAQPLLGRAARAAMARAPVKAVKADA